MLNFIPIRFSRSATCLAAVLAVSGLCFAQDAPPAPADQQNLDQQPQFAASAPGDEQPPPFDERDQPPPPPGSQGRWNRFGDRQPDDYRQNPPRSYARVPSQLNIRPGTFLTVRVEQGLSSDRNHEGDFFNATLTRPLVVDGVVVAEPGQTVAGRVVEAQKAGRVQGVARLAVQLTDLTLVDGQQVPIRSQLIGRTAPTSVGRDVGAIAGTTALGAAIGSSVAWGEGAAIGAASGAAAGIIGVLLTRGHPSIIYPESVLTFRIEAPVTIATDRAPDAFRYVEPNDYERPYVNQQSGRPRLAYAPPVPVAPYYYPAPYYYGPRFGLFFGPSFYGRYGYGYGRGGFFGGRGYRR